MDGKQGIHTCENSVKSLIICYDSLSPTHLSTHPHSFLSSSSSPSPSSSPPHPLRNGLLLTHHRHPVLAQLQARRRWPYGCRLWRSHRLVQHLRHQLNVSPTVALVRAYHLFGLSPPHRSSVHLTIHRKRATQTSFSFSQTIVIHYLLTQVNLCIFVSPSRACTCTVTEEVRERCEVGKAGELERL